MSDVLSRRETELQINDESIHIRPIRKSDTLLESRFLEGLSEESRRYRFLGGVKQLSSHEIEKLCDVDYHGSMAFVATKVKDGEVFEIGVARYCQEDPDTPGAFHPVLEGSKAEDGQHEMAVVIADEYRNTGLGKALLTQLFDYAKANNVKTLYSVDLHDNQDMKRLAKQTGMSVVADPADRRQLFYYIEL